MTVLPNYLYCVKINLFHKTKKYIENAKYLFIVLFGGCISEHVFLTPPSGAMLKKIVI